MAEIKALLDEFGVIFEASKNLPTDALKLKFIEALAELEDNTAHRTRKFPKTRLHKVVGVKTVSENNRIHIVAKAMD